MPLGMAPCERCSAAAAETGRCGGRQAAAPPVDYTAGAGGGDAPGGQPKGCGRARETLRLYFSRDERRWARPTPAAA